MAYLTPQDRLQLQIRSMEECVSKDNPVRFIDTFVEMLELPKLGFAVSEVKTEGRPAFNPKVFLKLQAAVDQKHNLVVATHTLNRNDRNAMSGMETLLAKLKRWIPDYGKAAVPYTKEGILTRFERFKCLRLEVAA